MLKTMPGALIMYALVEERREIAMRHLSQFHFVDSDEFLLLRSFMTLLCLPSSLQDLVPTKKQFTAAMKRRNHLPQFRKISAEEIHPLYWDALLKAPAVVLMTGNTIPNWAKRLSKLRPIALLTSSPGTFKRASQLPNFFAGLMKGAADIREFYRVTGESLRSLREIPNLWDEVPPEVQALDPSHLLENRPKLDFIPYFPLPQPWAGRSAAYLLNRLSNTVIEPSLLPPDSDERMYTVAMLNWSTAACSVLAAREQGIGIPRIRDVKPSDLSRVAKLLSSSEPNDKKFKAFLEVGRAIVEGGKIGHPFLVVPIPRLDVLKNAADGMVMDLKAPLEKRIATAAVVDFIDGKKKPEFTSPEAEQTYEDAHHTILQEQRLLSCQSAWLSAIDQTTPIQLRPLHGKIRNAFNDFLRSLTHQSRKAAELFRTLEVELALSLPTGISDVLKQAHTVTLFSDYPYEWTLIDDRPLCLHRPTARIPLSMSGWYNASASFTKPFALTPDAPEKVLVLDLLEKDDPLHTYSETFINSSAHMGNRFRTASPSTAAEARELINTLAPEIVLIDSHGKFDPKKDEASIQIKGRWYPFSEFLPEPPLPPVWFVSACDTAQSEAIRGCVARLLLARGAYAVIATLTRVDAFTASMLAGRLFADLYQPVHSGERNLADIFFTTQLTTALMYDPLLPLMRRSDKDPVLKKAFGNMWFELIQYFAGSPIDPDTYHHVVANKITECLLKHGLYETYRNLDTAGQVLPETLFFSIYGFPGLVTIEN